jgi:hypothetical protein
MSGPAKKGPKAPMFLEIIINDNDEKIWSGNMSNPINFPPIFGCYASKKQPTRQTEGVIKAGIFFSVIIRSKPGKLV